MTRSDALIESKTLREAYAGRIDALDKVKKLVMLPDDLHANIEMTATFFEVGVKTIESLIFDNRDELDTDGLKVLTGVELSSFKKESQIKSRAASLTIIPRQAILRIGMLLRDSLVARAVRDYLLDTETTSQKPLNEKDQLKATMKLALISSEEIDNLKSEVSGVKETIGTLVNTMRIDGAQEFKLRNSGQKKVLEVLGGINSPAYIEVGRKAFSELWQGFKQHFNLPRYSELPRSQFDEGLYFVSKWRPSTSLEIEIEKHNLQEQFRV